MGAIAEFSYGGVPVPYTVSWTGEDRHFVDRCPHAGRAALCQSIGRGQGKPAFGKPHSQRQRETIARGLCDLCARPLANRTKVSLSHARPFSHGADGWAVLQVEPLLHRECAAQSVRFCPSLKRDISAGSLMVRRVTRYRVQFAVMDPIFISHYVPDYVANPSDRIVGHAKVELLSWVDCDPDWLEALV